MVHETLHGCQRVDRWLLLLQGMFVAVEQDLFLPRAEQRSEWKERECTYERTPEAEDEILSSTR